MVLAYSYPLLSVFFTMLWFVGFFLWIWLVIAVFIDIFRSHDMGGFAKALWVIGVMFLPLVGVLAYLIARGGKMREHAVAEATARDEATQQYIKSVAGDGTSTAEELAKLAQLRDSGVITPAEFDQQKARLLSHAA